MVDFMCILVQFKKRVSESERAREGYKGTHSSALKKLDVWVH